MEFRGCRVSANPPYESVLVEYLFKHRRKQIFAVGSSAAVKIGEWGTVAVPPSESSVDGGSRFSMNICCTACKNFGTPCSLILRYCGSS